MTTSFSLSSAASAFLPKMKVFWQRANVLLKNIAGIISTQAKTAYDTLGKLFRLTSNFLNIT